MPSAWSESGAPAAATSESLAAWWQRFDDPALTALVDHALQANTSINSALAALRQAQALRDAAAAALSPTLDGTGSAQRGTSGGDSTGSAFKAGVNASWVPDIFGARRSALRATDATLLAMAATLGDTQVQIAAEVALNYIALRAAQARLAIAVDNLASQLETLQITQWRQQAGLTTVLEVEQARASTEQTRAQLPALRTSIGQNEHALALLLGEPPAALVQMTRAATAVPKAPANLALAIPADTLRRRADVRAAELQVVAARANVSRAEALRWPGFAIGGSLGLNALTLGALSNGSSVVSTLLASVTVPIFDAGAARAQVRSQQAALDKAHEVYRAAVLGALRDVEDALLALRSDRQRMQSLASAAEAATTASLLARQRYTSGLLDFQVVLETQRTRLATQDNLASARADVTAGHVRLFKSLGGGWTGTDATGRTTAISPAATPTTRP